jgi:hypothetical protein
MLQLCQAADVQLLKPIGQVILDRFVTQAERGSDFIADVVPLELPSIIYRVNSAVGSVQCKGDR